MLLLDEMLSPSTVTPSSVRLLPLFMSKYAFPLPRTIVPPPVMVTVPSMVMAPFTVTVTPLAIWTSFDMVRTSHAVFSDMTSTSPAACAVILPTGSMVNSIHKLSTVASKRLGCFLVSI